MALLPTTSQRRCVDGAGARPGRRPRSDCQDRTAPALPVCAVPDRTRGRRRHRVSCAAAAHGGLFCDPANITFLTATEASGNNERHLVGRGRALRGCPLAALRGWRPLRAVGAAAPRAGGSLRGGGRMSGRGGAVSATCAAGAHLPSFPPLSFLKIDAVEVTSAHSKKKKKVNRLEKITFSFC